MPAATTYHRWVGWHAPPLRRSAVAAVLGPLVAVVVSRFATWEVSLLAGWDAAALTVLVTVWPIIRGADGDYTEHLAMREDETRATESVLLVGASVASLLAVGFALGQAGRETGGVRVLLVGTATITVLFSWTLVNTLFTLRYAHLDFSAPLADVDFALAPGEKPDYRDFAYLAFTIGMTYQSSERRRDGERSQSPTARLRDPLDGSEAKRGSGTVADPIRAPHSADQKCSVVLRPAASPVHHLASDPETDEARLPYSWEVAPRWVEHAAATRRTARRARMTAPPPSTVAPNGIDAVASRDARRGDPMVGGGG